MDIWTYDFCFEADLPLNNEEATIVEGDIINILTLIDLSFPDLGEDKYGYDYDNTYIGNTYLATFLIELDPL